MTSLQNAQGAQKKEAAWIEGARRRSAREDERPKSRGADRRERLQGAPHSTRRTMRRRPKPHPQLGGLSRRRWREGIEGDAAWAAGSQRPAPWSPERSPSATAQRREDPRPDEDGQSPDWKNSRQGPGGGPSTGDRESGPSRGTRTPQAPHRTAATARPQSQRGGERSGWTSGQLLLDLGGDAPGCQAVLMQVQLVAQLGHLGEQLVAQLEHQGGQHGRLVGPLPPRLGDSQRRRRHHEAGPR